MIITSIHKAQAKISTKPVKDVTIEISREIPVMTVEKSPHFYREEGEELAYTLIHILPGGTLDQLTACLLQYKASLLRVSNFKPDKNRTKNIEEA
jgi:hypothetical protein